MACTLCERSDLRDFRRETDAARRRALRQSERHVGVTPCDPGVLRGVVGSVCASAVPAARSDKSSPAVGGSGGGVGGVGV